MIEFDRSSAPKLREYREVVPGGYVCTIERVVNESDKSRLYIEFDISEGPLKAYYTELFVNKGFWAGKYYRYYNEKSASYFEAFLTSLENSNPGYKWNGDESKLVGKSIGLILYKNGKYINVHQERSVDTIRKGEYKVPDSKTDAKAAFGGTEINTDDLPFK